MTLRLPLPHRALRTTAVVLVSAFVAGCGATGGDPTVAPSRDGSLASASATTTAAPAGSEAPPAADGTAAPPAGSGAAGSGEQAVAAPPAPPPPAPRAVHEQAWTPFATVEGLVLRHPSSRVERVGFHESNHEGARQLDILSSAANAFTMETRERGTGSRTAADVVVDPEVEIRAPVTGRVLRAGSYVLYCDNTDDFVVIEPDDRPGWEVKVLHISGVLVRPGDRVVAGETVIAPKPTILPFESQVDESTADPSWPHTHIEVVDPSIPNRPNPGGGGGC